MGNIQATNFGSVLLASVTRFRDTHCSKGITFLSRIAHLPITQYKASFCTICSKVLDGCAKIF